MTLFISAQEVAAHAQIRDLLDLRVARKVSRSFVEGMFVRLAAPIAPRCNCGGILEITRLPGRYLYTCPLCWHRYTEHQ